MPRNAPTDPALPTVGDTLDVELTPPTDSPAPGYYLTDEERRQATASAMALSATELWRRRWLLIAVGILAAVGSVIWSLMIPVYYEATATVLPPEASSSSNLSSLIGSLNPTAARVLGGSVGGGSDYTRYLAILRSREMQDEVIRRFDLIRVYENEDKRYPIDATRRELMKNLTVGVDLEYEFLAVSVLDRSPQRAAQIANFMVEDLNRRNEALAVENARRFREYVEERYEDVELALDSARQEMQAFQERNGVIELPSTAQALIEAAVQQRSLIAEAEMRYDALLAQYGPEHPDVQSAQSALQSARGSQESLLEGRERLLPVPLQRLPAVAGEYARIYQELMIQQALLETARPLYEQARFDEERDRTAVQVLDPAEVPERKSKPKRAVVVLSLTLSVVLLAVLVVLGRAWLRRNRAHLAAVFHAPMP